MIFSYCKLILRGTLKDASCHLSGQEAKGLILVVTPSKITLNFSPSARCEGPFLSQPSFLAFSKRTQTIANQRKQGHNEVTGNPSQLVLTQLQDTKLLP